MLDQKYISFSKSINNIEKIVWGKDRLLISSEVQKQLGISKTLLLRLIKKDIIKPIRLSERTFRFWKSDINKHEKA